ncbi:unnamed protein product, partial [Closterium sp. Naga37s-1]
MALDVLGDSKEQVDASGGAQGGGRGVKPDVYSFSVLLGAYAREGDWRRAEAAWGDMEACGVEGSDVAACKPTIQKGRKGSLSGSALEFASVTAMRAAAAGRAPWAVVKGVFCGLCDKMGAHNVSVSGNDGPVRALSECLHACQLALSPPPLPHHPRPFRCQSHYGPVNPKCPYPPPQPPHACSWRCHHLSSHHSLIFPCHCPYCRNDPPWWYLQLRAFNEYLHVCQLALMPAAALPEMIAGLRWIAQAVTVDGGDSNGGTVHGGALHILPDAATLNTLMLAMRRANRAAAGLLLYDLLTGREEEEGSIEREVLVRGKGDGKRDVELLKGGDGEGSEGGGGEREGKRSGGLTGLTLGDWAEFGRTGRLLMLERQLQGIEKRKGEKRDTGDCPGEKGARKVQRAWEEEERGVRELLGMLEAARVVTRESTRKNEAAAAAQGYKVTFESTQKSPRAVTRESTRKVRAAARQGYRGGSVDSGSGGSSASSVRGNCAYNGDLPEGVDWQRRVCVKPDCVTVTEVILAKVALGQDEGALEVFWGAVGGREGGGGWGRRKGKQGQNGRNCRSTQSAFLVDSVNSVNLVKQEGSEGGCTHVQRFSECVQAERPV